MGGVVYIGVSEDTVCQRQCKETYLDSYLSTGKKKNQEITLVLFGSLLEMILLGF